jgi:hypothetical protein
MIEYKEIHNGDDIDLIEFNHKHFNYHSNGRYLKFILNESPFLSNIITKGIVCIIEKKLIGQILSIPAKYYIGEKSKYCVFGCDYIVESNHRDTSAGVFLLKKLLKKNEHFAIGPNPSGISYKLHVTFGEKHIGNSRIYFYPNIFNPSSIFRLIFNRIGFNTKNANYRTSIIPDSVRIDNKSFELIKDKNIISVERGYKSKWFENSIIEFDRSADFLKWRYFNDLHKYYFYEYKVSKNSLQVDGYIVLRPVQYKNWLDSLLVVDYRFNDNSISNLKLFIKFAKEVLNQTSISNLMLSNSLYKFDKTIKKQFFKIFSYPILSNSMEINESSNIFVTFADSDTDLIKNDL